MLHLENKKHTPESLYTVRDRGSPNLCIRRPKYLYTNPRIFVYGTPSKLCIQSKRTMLRQYIKYAVIPGHFELPIKKKSANVRLEILAISYCK